MIQVHQTKSVVTLSTISAAMVLMVLAPAMVQADDTEKPLQEAETAYEQQGKHNGQVLRVDGLSKAWEASSQQWISLDNFWQNWADSRGGITWGRSEDYPAYEHVKEQDTLLIELDAGTCMMEFWHERWRRANDVRRWDDGFNTYSACNKVFD